MAPGIRRLGTRNSGSWGAGRRGLASGHHFPVVVLHFLASGLYFPPSDLNVLASDVLVSYFFRFLMKSDMIINPFWIYFF